MFRGKKYCSLMIRGEKKTEKKLKAVESFFFLEKKKKKKTETDCCCVSLQIVTMTKKYNLEFKMNRILWFKRSELINPLTVE